MRSDARSLQGDGRYSLSLNGSQIEPQRACGTPDVERRGVEVPASGLLDKSAANEGKKRRKASDDITPALTTKRAFRAIYVHFYRDLRTMQKRQ